MSGTAAARPREREPKTDIGVADQFTSRSARAVAHRVWWGKTEGEFSMRELDLTVSVQYGDTENYAGVTPDSSAFVECTIHSDKDDFRKFSIQSLQLGDLPLLVLALQEAIRLGAEHGSFCKLSPNAWEIADTIKATLEAESRQIHRSAAG